MFVVEVCSRQNGAPAPSVDATNLVLADEEDSEEHHICLGSDKESVPATFQSGNELNRAKINGHMHKNYSRGMISMTGMN